MTAAAATSHWRGRDPEGAGAGADLAIVGEQVGDVGGTERVLAALLERYPLARVLAPRFGNANVTPDQEPAWATRVVEVRGGSRKRHHLAPLYARRLARANLGSVRLVLSLAHTGWSAAAAVPPGARHLCYSAGPPRAFYEQSSMYLLDYPPVLRAPLRLAIPAVRAHHRRMMRRPHRLVTNSRWSAAALARLVDTTPDVVYPPVRTDFFTPAPAERRHFLTVARLRPHKRVDVAIEAFRGLDHELVVAGGGPGLARLRERAPANVRFTGYVSDAELRALYRESHAVICPSVEEFGIVMAEAHATATPVIAPRAGGALEIVDDGLTGILLDRVEPREITAAVRAVSERSFVHDALLASAERFSVARFLSGIDAVIAEERERANPLLADRSVA